MYMYMCIIFLYDEISQLKSLVQEKPHSDLSGTCTDTCILLPTTYMYVLVWHHVLWKLQDLEYLGPIVVSLCALVYIHVHVSPQ